MPTRLSLWEFILWHFGKLKTETTPPPDTDETPYTLVKLSPSDDDYSDLIISLEDFEK